MIKKLLLYILAMNVSVCFAEIKLPAVLANNMVLQQKSNANLWGKATKLATITVFTSWNKKEYRTDADAEGNWLLNIATPKAGGPYTITLNDGEKAITLQNILIGEVWVCSGQSNMEMPLAGFKNQPILNSATLIANAKNESLRLFKVERFIASSPQTDCKGIWKESDSISAKTFSAVAFQYGQLLQQKLGIPVGIIVASWGGTAIAPWIPSPIITDTSKIKLSANGVLFNGMIAPITKFTIKGFLWYQGETDRFKPTVYKAKMIDLVEKWRTEWKNENAPFYFVQIAPYQYKDSAWSSSAELREAQLEASYTIKNAAMVTTLDVGAANLIHPPDKTTVANRLVNCALANTYGKKIAYQFPAYESLKQEGNNLILIFKHAKELVLKNKESDNFEIAGADNVFYKANVQVAKNTVILSSEKVSTPTVARYGFTNFLVGDLFNEHGIPASPFRTSK